MVNYRVHTQKIENTDKKENKEMLHELSLNGLDKEEDLRLVELKLEDDKSNEKKIDKKTSNNKNDIPRDKSPIKEQQGQETKV